MRRGRSRSPCTRRRTQGGEQHRWTPPGPQRPVQWSSEASLLRIAQLHSAFLAMLDRGDHREIRDNVYVLVGGMKDTHAMAWLPGEPRLRVTIEQFRRLAAALGTPLPPDWRPRRGEPSRLLDVPIDVVPVAADAVYDGAGMWQILQPAARFVSDLERLSTRPAELEAAVRRTMEDLRRW